MLFKKKYILSRATKLQQLEAIIGKLRPIGTEHKLIRWGGSADGGYLIPDDLKGVVNCFSPGVDQKSEFELHCAEMGMKVFLADASVDKPAADHANFEFAKNYIGGFSRDNIIGFSEWFDRAEKNEGDSMLQMDVEGFEYEIIPSIPTEIIKNLRVIVVEFHQLSRLLERSFYDAVSHVFEKLYSTHVAVHIHPNNYAGAKYLHGIQIPDYLEVTYLRRDRFTEESAISELSHPLDQDCCPGKRSLLLENYWLKK